MMRFDLHVHTRNSYDSFSSVKNIIKYAKKRRLNGIAITDHEHSVSDEYIDGYLNDDIWIIKGSEICTEIGDIIGLFLSEPLKSRNSVDLIREIHDQNGISILAHPFKRTSYSYSEEILNMLDAVEVANARWRDLNLITHNPEVRHLLSLVRGRSAGSDAHFSFEVGRAYLTTPYVTTQEELKKIICSGAGGVVCNHSSEWLDFLSQGIKFLKSPSIKQFLRLIYWSGRHLIFSNRRRL
jgi:predicted metal-dependent phosphoesterase TrpH